MKTVRVLLLLLLLLLLSSSSTSLLLPFLGDEAEKDGKSTTITNQIHSDTPAEQEGRGQEEGGVNNPNEEEFMFFDTEVKGEIRKGAGLHEEMVDGFVNVHCLPSIPHFVYEETDGNWLDISIK